MSYAVSCPDISKVKSCLFMCEPNSACADCCIATCEKEENPASSVVCSEAASAHAAEEDLFPECCSSKSSPPTDAMRCLLRCGEFGPTTEGCTSDCMADETLCSTVPGDENVCGTTWSDFVDGVYPCGFVYTYDVCHESSTAVANTTATATTTPLTAAASAASTDTTASTLTRGAGAGAGGKAGLENGSTGETKTNLNASTDVGDDATRGAGGDGAGSLDQGDGSSTKRTVRSGWIVAGVLIVILIVGGVVVLYTRRATGGQQRANNAFAEEEASRNSVAMEMNPLSAAGRAHGAAAPPPPLPEYAAVARAQPLDVTGHVVDRYHEKKNSNDANVNYHDNFVAETPVYAVYASADSVASAPTSTAAQASAVPGNVAYAIPLETGGIAYASLANGGGGAAIPQAAAAGARPNAYTFVSAAAGAAGNATYAETPISDYSPVSASAARNTDGQQSSNDYAYPIGDYVAGSGDAQQRGDDDYATPISDYASVA